MSHISESSVKLQKAGTRWKAVLITPGQGSSGTYSEEMLRSTGASAFPAGTHSYIDHKPLENRSPRDLFGVLTEDAHYEDGVGLVSTIEVMPHFKEFADAVAKHAALSIYADAEITADGVVEALVANRTNTVDLVSYAGREGSGLAEKLLESARSSFTTSSTKEDSGTAPAADRNHTGKEKVSMEIEDLAKRVDTLAESLNALASVVTPLAESLAAEKAEKAEKEAEEAEKSTELDFAAIAEAAYAAGLPEPSRKVVYEQVRFGGASVQEAIEAQKGLVEALKKQVAESLGATIHVGGSNDTNQDFLVRRWGASE